MQSKHDILYYAKKAARENPEVADALMEFERTGKVPKTTYRKRIDVTLDESVVRKLRSRSSETGIPVSRLIEKAVLSSLVER